ncbi:ATP-binding cassette domain-containing protein [Seohaeicola zhoushanensis]
MEARALGLRFGAVEALKDVSIRIEAGSVHALIGPNGAGKSSLLNCLSGFYHPWTGAVLFEGRDISATRPPERARLGIARTFQGIQTYPSMTARENILTGFHAQMKGGVFSGLFRPAPRSGRRRNSPPAPRRSSTFSNSNRTGTAPWATCPTACASGSTWAARWRSPPRSW